MVYNTENGASFQRIPYNSQILGKRQLILLLEIEKKENKTLKTFQKLLEQTNKSSHYRSGRARAVEGMFMRKTTKNYTCLAILVSYLNNFSEETLFGHYKIKEQYETIKLQNEEVMIKNA